jgi:hypothetical protein
MIALCLRPSVIRFSYPIANGISTGGREPSDGYHPVGSNDLRGWDRISGETLPPDENATATASLPVAPDHIFRARL